METNLLLNIYRTSIASDPEGLKILSLLLREGPKSDVELGKALDISVENIKKKINDLYQASLINLVQNEKLTLTELGQSVLSNLGIRDIAVKSFISTKEIPDWQNTFLKACIETLTSLDFDREQHYFNLLRSLNVAESSLSWWDKGIRDLESRLRFSLIAGLDAESYDMEGEAYCNKIFDWHKKKSTILWREKGSSLLKHRNALAHSCIDALANVKTCKDILFYGKDIKDENAEEISLRLLYLKFLSVLLNEQSERDLKTAYWFNESIVEKSWAELRKLASNIEKDTSLILLDLLPGARYEDISKEFPEYYESSLVERLKRILREQAQPKGQTAQSRTFIHDVIHQKQLRGKEKTQENSIIQLVRKMRVQLGKGEFEHLTRVERIELCKEVEELSHELNREFLTKNI